MSIEALQDFCIVKGKGDTGKAFDPSARTSRAEFVKMLIKIIYIGKVSFGTEGIPAMSSAGESGAVASA